MSGALVNWADYGGASALAEQGFDFSDDSSPFAGLHTMAEVDSLNKALAAGSEINNPGASPGEGFPLRVESLDSTLFSVTYTADKIKMWKRLYKDAAFNTIEEFNQLQAYGSSDAIYVPEGELPEEDDSTYKRNYTRIKFMGITRRVTHVMSVTRTAHGDAVARESVNGTLQMLQHLERGLFDGDENNIEQQFDGLETLMVKAFDSTTAEDGQYLGYEDELNVIDLRGDPLNEDVVADMVEQLIKEPNWGSPTDLWAPTGPIKDLSKIMYPKERINLPAPNMGTAGVVVDRIATPFGTIALNSDVFFPDSVTAPTTGSGKAAKRPGTPTAAAPTSPVYAGSNTTFWSTGDAGTYIYKIVAGSRFGRSAPVTTAAVVVSAGDQVSISVTDAGPDTSYYEVYRSANAGTADTCRTIFRVPRTATVQTIVDLNRFLPNTSKALMLSQSPEVFKWKQLAPFTKISLGVVDPTIRWMQLLYGALQMMKPRYNGMFINVGKLPTGVNAA